MLFHFTQKVAPKWRRLYTDYRITYHYYWQELLGSARMAELAKFEPVKRNAMEKIVKIESVAQYNKMRGIETLHPLVSVIDLSKVQPIPAQSFNFGIYSIYLKEVKCGELRYGRNTYDYQEGTLVFVAPGQVLGVPARVSTFEPKGWALLFHPDLIKGLHWASISRTIPSSPTT